MPCAYERGREREGERCAVSEYQYCLSVSFQLFFLKSTQNVRGEKKKLGERVRQTQTDRGRFNLSRFSFGEDWKSNFATKSIFCTLDQLSYDIDKHESLLFLFDFLENISIENTFRNYEFLSVGLRAVNHTIEGANCTIEDVYACPFAFHCC